MGPTPRRESPEGSRFPPSRSPPAPGSSTLRWPRFPNHLPAREPHLGPLLKSVSGRLRKLLTGGEEAELGARPLVRSELLFWGEWGTEDTPISLNPSAQPVTASCQVSPPLDNADPSPAGHHGQAFTITPTLNTVTSLATVCPPSACMPLPDQSSKTHD